MSVTELFGALAGLPRFKSPACTDHIWLFDEAINDQRGRVSYEAAQARRMCVEVCAGCSALDSCRQWVLSLPPGIRPEGVVGGIVVDRRGRTADIA